MKNNDSSRQSSEQKNNEEYEKKLDELVKKFPKVAKNLDKRKDNPAIKELSKAFAQAKVDYDTARTYDNKKKAIETLLKKVDQFDTKVVKGQNPAEEKRYNRFKNEFNSVTVLIKNSLDRDELGGGINRAIEKIDTVKPKSTIPRAVINQAKAAMSSATTAVAKKMPFNKRRTEKKATSMTK